MSGSLARRTAVAVLALGTALPAAAIVTGPAQAAGHTTAQAVKIDRHRPTRPVARATGVAGGVRFSWSTSKHATRYRVHWAPAAFNQWPKSAGWYVDRTTGGWVSKYRRSSVRKVPTNPATDRTMTALPFGNPLFGQVQANNSRARRGATNTSTWVMAFPQKPAPAAGPTFRMGTYNILGSGPNFDARVPYLTKNIADHRLDVVSLQEIRKGNLGKVLSQLSSRTQRTWRAATTSTDELAVVYRADRFEQVGTGTFTVARAARGTALKTPWVRLRPLAGGAQFIVVPAHFAPSAPSDGSHQAVNNRQTGESARDLIAKLAAAGLRGVPTIVAGDFTSNHTRFGDLTPAQPTFVRVGGFWDALSARAKSGVAYGTVNKQAAQKRANSGLGGRPDAIFLRGFSNGGSTSWVNVANWYGGYGKPPSDHNLVYADVVLPPG
jgi:hypothetical protein